jgi:hypothetical protein
MMICFDDPVVASEDDMLEAGLYVHEHQGMVKNPTSHAIDVVKLKLFLVVEQWTELSFEGQ